MIHLGGSATAHDDLQSLLCDISELRPHVENPRNGDVEAIAESITVNGLYRPIYAQRSTGMVLAGNHTYAAAMSLGATRLPVVWLDISDIQAKRILLADNRTAELGNYDNGLLLRLLEDVEHADEQLLLHGTGFEPADIDALLRLVEAEQYQQVDASAEWVGMPDHPDSELFDTNRVTIHFQSAQHRDEFFELIERAPARSLYWPRPWDEQQRRFSRAGDDEVRAVS